MVIIAVLKVDIIIVYWNPLQAENIIINSNNEQNIFHISGNLYFVVQK